MWLDGSYEAESSETKGERAEGAKGKGLAYTKHLQHEKH